MASTIYSKAGTDTAIADYLTAHPVDAPVTSVNGKTGAVVLDAADVGADPAGTAQGLVDALVIPDPDLSGYVQTTDPRLSDDRTPTAHSHPIADVTGLQAALDGKQAAGSYAPASHGHTAGQVSGLATVAATGDYADLTGKPTLGTAAATAATDYATAAQGAKADTALQPATGQAINAQTGTTYTLVAADAGKLVTCTNADAITLTAPGSVFSAGQRVDVVVLGEGMATVVASGGATVQPEAGLTLVTRAQRSAFTILWLSATDAVVTGSMAAA